MAVDSSSVTRLQYWILNGASLLVALLIAFEMRSVHQLDKVTVMVQQAQVPIAQAQQHAPQVQRMIQRTALGATHDPALQELLAKYGITVKPAWTSGGSDSTSAAQPAADRAGVSASTAASSTGTP